MKKSLNTPKQEHKSADYAKYREQDRAANASSIQGEFAGYDRPAPLSDDEIQKEAIEIVAANTDVEAEQVLIEVKDGVLTLRGMVANSEIRNWIENAVHTIPGVHQLDDQLMIPSSGKESPEYTRLSAKHALR